MPVRTFASPPVAYLIKVEGESPAFMCSPTLLAWLINSNGNGICKAHVIFVRDTLWHNACSQREVNSVRFELCVTILCTWIHLHFFVLRSAGCLPPILASPFVDTTHRDKKMSQAGKNRDSISTIQTQLDHATLHLKKIRQAKHVFPHVIYIHEDITVSIIYSIGGSPRLTRSNSCWSLAPAAERCSKHSPTLS